MADCTCQIEVMKRRGIQGIRLSFRWFRAGLSSLSIRLFVTVQMYIPLISTFASVGARITYPLVYEGDIERVSHRRLLFPSRIPAAGKLHFVSTRLLFFLR